jgi:uncharacterized membrane protein
MSEGLDLAISQQGKGIYLWIIPFVAVGVYWIYQLTQPVVRSRVRWLLIGLRVASLSLILLVLAELIFSFWHNKIERPAVLALVDVSPSMDIEEAGFSRLNRVKTLIKSDAFKSMRKVTRESLWAVGEEPFLVAQDQIDSLEVYGKATDLSRALRGSIRQMQERKNLESILLISDGAHNLGEDPVRAAEELGVPIYSLGVGSAEAPADIQIFKIVAPPTGYLASPVEMEVYLRHWGYEKRQIEVALYEGDQELMRKSTILPSQDQIAKVVFQVDPTQAGPRIYRFYVMPQEGEILRHNNEALVHVHILQAKTRVLILAGGPSIDMAFARRALAADSNLVVETRTMKDDNRFYEEGLPVETLLKDKDAVVLLDMPMQTLDSVLGEALKDYVTAGGGLLFKGVTKSLDRWEGGHPVAGLLPVVIPLGIRLEQQMISLQATANGQGHPVIRLKNRSDAEEGDPWAKLPPLPSALSKVQVKDGATVLVESRAEGLKPLIVAGTFARGKVIAFLAESAWRLDLLSSGVGGQPHTIRRFWRNAVKWLALEESTDLVRVASERHIYRGGQEVRFIGQVFDELLRPEANARVELGLDSVDRTIQLQAQGDGTYSGTWLDIEPGKYRFKAKAVLDGSLIGTDQGHFIIEEYTIETADIRANNARLHEMSRISGGAYAALDEWPALEEKMNLQAQLVQRNLQISLWGRTDVLILVMALLSIEWIGRRRYGML